MGPRTFVSELVSLYEFKREDDGTCLVVFRSDNPQPTVITMRIEGTAIDTGHRYEMRLIPYPTLGDDE